MVSVGEDEINISRITIITRVSFLRALHVKPGNLQLAVYKGTAAARVGNGIPESAEAILSTSAVYYR